MALQTGTLKFRQSDGAYTDLYPKTTIAQVDGLQTQLDSINTSLQNKVDLINTSVLQMIVGGSIYDYNADYPFITMVDKNKNRFQWGKSGVNYVSASLRFIDSTADSIIEMDINDYGVQYIKFQGQTITTNVFLASQDYVNDKISRAITASY